MDRLIFNHNDDIEEIEGFTIKCKCGSENISIEYSFHYYGGATGYDGGLSIICLECNHYIKLVTL